LNRKGEGEREDGQEWEEEERKDLCQARLSLMLMQFFSTRSLSCSQNSDRKIDSVRNNHKLIELFATRHMYATRYYKGPGKEYLEGKICVEFLASYWLLHMVTHHECLLSLFVSLFSLF
jgi:hypothetical protein